MRYFWILLITLGLASPIISAPSLRIAAYGGEIPHQLIEKFQKQTGIKIYLTTFESNENLFLKIKSSKNQIYDLITPSHYYVNRFIQFNMLEPLQVSSFIHYKELNPYFVNPHLKTVYGIPFLWGVTGIFYNSSYIHHPPKHWQDLWEKQYNNQLLLLDDTREVFSMALLSLGLTPNTFNLHDLEIAYQQLKKLSQNIKLLASDAMPSIIINEDAKLGMAWNGDVIKAQTENMHIKFILPPEGFVVWAECFAIPKGAKNAKHALQFIDFILDAKNSAEITRVTKFAVTNEKAKKYLPEKLASHPYLFLNQALLKQGTLQQDAPEDIIKTYNAYWELFKISL
jgi:spermidine/putrescine transport system substrate-binding protein